MIKNNSPNLNENDSKKDLEQIIEIGISKLKNFEKHPFKVNDETLEELKASIAENGITTPLIVRPLKDGEYEIVSGHRRKRACELLGIDKIPCIVRDISRDEAIIQMVDSNIQREEVLPSERAFAYKMKLDAMKHQGKRNDLTSVQNAQKSGGKTTREILGEQLGESQDKVRRYIRLTELIPELLEMVDTGRIGFSPAVEISYLREHEQKLLLNAIDFYDHTPSLSQAQTLKELSKNYELTEDTLEDIMCEEKPNQIPKINIPYTRVEKYLPRNVVTPREVETYFIKCAIICKERGINVEKMDIQLDEDSKVIKNTKNKDRDSR